ncbi:hypothetical protein MRX96_001698 [Rhipicephalus microplus]
MLSVHPLQLVHSQDAPANFYGASALELSLERLSASGQRCSISISLTALWGVSDFSQAPATRKAADAGNNDPYVGGGWHNSETGQVLSNYMTWQRPFAVGFGYLSEG